MFLLRAFGLAQAPITRRLVFSNENEEEIEGDPLLPLDSLGDIFHHLILLSEGPIKEWKIWRGINSQVQILVDGIYLRVIGNKGGHKSLSHLPFFEIPHLFTTLNFSCYRMKTEAVMRLGEILKGNKTITHLHLNSNDAYDDGAKAIAEALKVNTVLTSIDLSSNGIGEEGAKAIGEALKENSTLTHLSFHQNLIGDEGARMIGEGIKHNKTLLYLNLSSCRIGDQGASWIAEGIKQNNSITTISLDLNDFCYEGSISLVEALEENKSIINLDLSNREIDYDYRDEIEDLIQLAVSKPRLE